MEEKKRKVSLTLRVDEDLHRMLKLNALRKDTTIQGYILGLIKEDIANKQEDRAFGQG